MTTKESLIQIAAATALNYGIDPALVCSVCATESSWNQYATQYEPGFFARYVEPVAQTNTFGRTISQATERKDRATSFGLMQILGQVAREYGYQEEFLAGLYEPVENTLWGCKRLKHALTKANGVAHVALLDWNGGGDAHYPDRVMDHYKDYAYLNARTA